MTIAIKEIEIDTGAQKLVQELYEAYANRLMAYTRKNYNVPEDDAMSLVYKTIYRIAEVKDRYSFESEQKRSAFVFKTYINYLRNYYRDNRSFENRNLEVEVNDLEAAPDEASVEGPRLRLLQQLLDRMEDWERVLLLMRGQGIPYSEISRFVDKPEKQLKVYYARLKQKLMDDMNEWINKNNREK